MDNDPQRLQRVEDNLQRLSLEAELVEGDALNPPDALLPASFDRILVDAPCSGSGVIRRHPDIKLLRRKEDIPSFSATQEKILQGCWALLRPGGCLLYATCSILPEENGGVVAKFVAANGDARLSPIDAQWGQESGGMRTLLSSREASDGMFYALIYKLEQG
jgi:16S rRNA (cytosine967-C5)-methyltransferase